MDIPQKPEDLSQPDDYGAEVLCAGWNPVISAVVEPIRRACRRWIDDPPAADAESFLRAFYRHQS